MKKNATRIRHMPLPTGTFSSINRQVLSARFRINQAVAFVFDVGSLGVHIAGNGPAAQRLL
jgi:hypothetical protein